MVNPRRRLTITATLTALVLVMSWSAVIAQSPFQRNDRDGDGRLSAREFPGSPPAFRRLDLNGDGYLTPQEIQQARGQRGQGGPQRRSDSSGQRQQPSGTAAPVPVERSGPQRSGPLRFIDTHMHLHPVGLDKAHGNQGGGQGGVSGAARLDEATALATAAENLIARMDELRLSTALIVVIPSSRRGREQSYRLLRDTVRAHPDRLRLMAGGSLLQEMLLKTDPGAVTETIKRRFTETAERLLSEGATGFGEMMAYHLCMNPKHKFEAAAPDHPLFLLLSDIAADNDVPIDLHMEAIENQAPVPENLLRRCDKNPDQLLPTIPGLEQLLRHNRKARIVWQHIGWDNTGQMTPALMHRLLKAHANLYLSMRVTEQLQTRDGRAFPNRIVDTRRRLKPEWLDLMKAFPDRIMLGADEFVGPSSEPAKLAASLEATWAVVDQLPEALADTIGGANAKRVYGLE